MIVEKLDHLRPTRIPSFREIYNRIYPTFLASESRFIVIRATLRNLS